VVMKIGSLCGPPSLAGASLVFAHFLERAKKQLVPTRRRRERLSFSLLFSTRTALSTGRQRYYCTVSSPMNTVMRGKRIAILINMFAVTRALLTSSKTRLLSWKFSTAFQTRSVHRQNVAFGSTVPLIRNKISSCTTLTKPALHAVRLASSLNADSIPDSKQISKHLLMKENQTIYQTLLLSINLLEENNAPEPTASACHLLSFALKDDFQWEDNGFAVLLNILENPNYNKISHQYISSQELDFYADMLERRIAKEPLQYIIGQWDFHDFVLKVRAPCLCPR